MLMFGILYQHSDLTELSISAARQAILFEVIELLKSVSCTSRAVSDKALEIGQ